jgi:hypothetical protein
MLLENKKTALLSLCNGRPPKFMKHLARQLRRRTAILLLVLTGLLSQVACFSKRPAVVTREGFRLQSVNNDLLLMTPPVPVGQPANSPLEITSGLFSIRPQQSSICRAENGPFKLEPKSESSAVHIELPSPNQWLQDLQGRSEVGSRDDFQSLHAFLGEVDRLQDKNCFVNPDAETLKTFILATLPSRATEGAFSSRSSSGALDLKAGMRLKIERAYFDHAAVTQERGFQGIESNYFDAEPAEGGKITFRKAGDTQYSSPVVAEAAKASQRDVQLGSISEPFQYRLLFYTYLVPQEARISAAVIGAATVVQLDDLERQVRSNPDEICKRIRATKEPFCVPFEGAVTVSAQFSVTVNGAPRFVDWGSKVNAVLPAESDKKKLKSLRIQRRFMNSYYDVYFDRRESNILSIPVIDGDRISW